jgi:hypothetical protein
MLTLASATLSGTISHFDRPSIRLRMFAGEVAAETPL